MSIHVDDEFSLRIALESELDDVVPSDGLAGLVIARHRKIRRRRVAGVVSLLVVCAGIGIPLSLSGPSGKPPQHNPQHRTDQHTGSTLIPHARAVAAAAGAVSLVVVCAGIGVRFGLSGPTCRPPQQDPGQRPDQHTGSVTLIPRARAEAALVIDLPAPSRHRRRGGPPMPHRTGQSAIPSPAAAAAVSSGWKERDGPAAVTAMDEGLKHRLAA